MASANLPLVLGGLILIGVLVLYSYRVEKPRNVRLFVLFGFASSASLALFLLNDVIPGYESLDTLFLAFQWLFLGLAVYAHRIVPSRDLSATGG